MFRHLVRTKEVKIPYRKNNQAVSLLCNDDIIDKLKAFFEKYTGIGTAFRSKPVEE